MRKHQKVTTDDEHDTSQINDFHAFKQLLFIYFYNLLYLFAYFWLCWVFLAECSLFWLWQAGVLSSGNALTSPFGGISHRREWDRGVGTSGHGPQALAGCSVVVVLGLSCSTVCGVFLDRDPACIPGADQWILNHRTAREVPFHAFLCEKW